MSGRRSNSSAETAQVNQDEPRNRQILVIARLNRRTVLSARNQALSDSEMDDRNRGFPFRLESLAATLHPNWPCDLNAGPHTETRPLVPLFSGSSCPCPGHERVACGRIKAKRRAPVPACSCVWNDPGSNTGGVHDLS